MTIKTFQFNPFQENTYLVFDETREAAIIDCGCLYPAEEEQLKNAITTDKLVVKRLLNTHLHLDHLFGNYMVAQTYGVLPEAHAADEFLISETSKQAQLFGIPTSFREQPLGSYLNDGDEVTFGRTEFEVIHVPGHSPGGICFFCRAEKLVFVGDVLFAGSIGRTDLPRGKHSALIAAIQNRLFTLPDETVVYPGHGPTTTIGAERLHNPFF